MVTHSWTRAVWIPDSGWSPGATLCGPDRLYKHGINAIAGPGRGPVVCMERDSGKRSSLSGQGRGCRHPSALDPVAGGKQHDARFEPGSDSYGCHSGCGGSRGYRIRDSWTPGAELGLVSTDLRCPRGRRSGDSDCELDLSAHTQRNRVPNADAYGDARAVSDAHRLTLAVSHANRRAEPNPHCHAENPRHRSS